MQWLASMLGVSDMTIRRDLGRLEASGMLRRTHGGAVGGDVRLMEVPFGPRKSEHAREKQAIAMAAVNLVKPGENLILDAGSTTYMIAVLLKNRHLQGLTGVSQAKVGDLKGSWG